MTRVPTWDRFRSACDGARGIQLVFEDLCRQLFEEEYLSGNKKQKHVCCNPNNKGLEAEPVYDEINQRWLGFQAKYFKSKTDYKQILHSAEKIVEYYNGKVNHVVLYCNNDLETGAKTFQQAVKILTDHNISIERITNQVLLNQVSKYKRLEEFYFDLHHLSHEWLVKHNRRMFDNLGERYTPDFNVNTNASFMLSLFVRDNRSVRYINEKKKNLLEWINSYRESYYSYFSNLLDEVVKSVYEISDVKYENEEESFQWESRIISNVSVFFDRIESKEQELKVRQEELQAKVEDKNKSKEEKDSVKQEYNIIKREEEALHSLKGILMPIRFTTREQDFITKKVLFVTGKVGTGKSQLLGNQMNILLEEGRDGLLLLGGQYLTDMPVCRQIMQNCNLDFSFDMLIDLLETLGAEKNRIVPVFIDALNETWNYDLWLDALPAIIDKIETCEYVKLVISFRSEYAKLLVNQRLTDRLKDGSICHINHRGFEGYTDEAKNKFFDHYRIPFTPYEYFKGEMDNPLFLKLYCQTYQGDEASLPELYERLIKNINSRIQIALRPVLKKEGHAKDTDLMTAFINELVTFLIKERKRWIEREELEGLRYWQTYRLTAPAFISQLEKEHLLYHFISEGREFYYFAYDQMVDYFCARVLIRQAKSKTALKGVLLKKILCVKDGRITEPGNMDLFINAAALYAERYHEECIDLVERITDEENKRELLERYILSYQWRKKDTISVDLFLHLMKTQPLLQHTFWKVLISNSVKTEHPLNADFLHKVLSSYALNERDYLWTLYIDRFFGGDNGRMYQLVHKYARGEILVMKNEKQTELLLSLFAWFLTSSDRSWRDSASKAMVEILKEKFDLCEFVLRKFASVNDPYVRQRLYGIVFGACCKRKGEQIDWYRSLAEYVYKAVFDQKKVFPDILLRDYARLIIERFLWEQPGYQGFIVAKKITPPYKSSPIPKIKKDYSKMKYEDGMAHLHSSMQFVKNGMYGDFGRYVFETALNNFEVEHGNIYNYAMSFIIKDLGYREELFGKYDHELKRLNFNRFDSKKTERIGKKYQWIAMHNILARVSDYCRMIDRYNVMGTVELGYDNAGQLGIRDFDPTLNQYFMQCEKAPSFAQMDEFVKAARQDNENVVETWEGATGKAADAWLDEKGFFLTYLQDILALKDIKGKQWISLTKFFETRNPELDNEKLLVWSWLCAFFVAPELEAKLRYLNSQGADLRCFSYRPLHPVSMVYNREYPWSSACKAFKSEGWTECDMRLGEFKLGEMLRASYEWTWDAEYDASNEKPVSWNVPCLEIVKTLGLSQNEYDGFFFDKKGQLAAFDTSKVQKNLKGRAVLRKDLLDQFLKKRNLRLVWFVDAGKEIHDSVYRKSSWSGLLTYDGEKINGDVFRIKDK